MGMVWGHQQEAQLLSYLKDGVSAFKSRTEEYWGRALEVVLVRRVRGSVVPQSRTEGPHRVRTVGSCSSTLTGMSGELGRRPGLDRSRTI